MSEYISREAALEVFCRWCGICPKEKQKPLECDDILGNVLHSLPAADVRPVVRGKWVMSDMQEGWVTCSVCKKMKFDGRMAFSPTLFVEWGLNFCPNCGADMKEEDDHG